MNWLPFLAQNVPSTWMDVVLLPGLCAAFAALVYGLALRKEASGESASWKWIALVFLAFGAFAGLGTFLDYVGNDFESVAYRSLNEIRGRKMLAAHWAAFWGPVAGIVAILLYETWFKHRPRGRD